MRQEIQKRQGDRKLSDFLSTSPHRSQLLFPGTRNGLRLDVLALDTSWMALKAVCGSLMYIVLDWLPALVSCPWFTRLRHYPMWSRQRDHKNKGYLISQEIFPFKGSLRAHSRVSEVH